MDARIAYQKLSSTYIDGWKGTGPILGAFGNFVAKSLDSFFGNGAHGSLHRWVKK